MRPILWLPFLLIGLLLNSCSSPFKPPYNNFEPRSSGIHLYKSNNKLSAIKGLEKHDIQLIQHGNTNTLIVPTDRYFYFNTAQLNDVCYEGLTNIVRLLRFYPQSTIFVAGFTDNVGSTAHKKILTQARAETMLTFLWANGIKAKRLHAEGYADKYAVGQNTLIHGSAYNRRLEIQWFEEPEAPRATMPMGYTK